jgi:protein O-GlcNAc transferase
MLTNDFSSYTLELTGIFQHGLKLHQQGQLVHAKALYEKVLEKQPDHFDALHLLGVIAAQSGSPEIAADLIGKAIKINPKSASAHSNLGNALKSLNRLDEAVICYDEAIAIQPDYAEAFNNRGNALNELMRTSEALLSYEKAIALQPNYVEALFNHGNALKILGRLGEALASYDKAVTLKPDFAFAFNNRGSALDALNRTDEALASYDKAIALQPNFSESLYNRGHTLQRLKRSMEALASFDQALAIQPDFADALSNRGNALKALGRLEESLESYDKALALRPDFADAWNNRGNALIELQRFDDALACYEKAISIQPGFATTLNNLGNALKQLKRLDEALASYDKSLAIQPDYADALYNRGSVLKELNRLDEALICYDKAIALLPDFAEAHNNRGIILKEFNYLDEALVCYSKAIAIKPSFAEAFCNRGNALKELKRFEEALASYDMAISLKPNYAEAINNQGTAFQELKLKDEALKSYDMAIAMQPDYVDAHYNRGNLLIELKRLEEALESYNKALALQPDYNFLLGLQLNTRASLCDWRELPEQLASLELALEAERKVIIPFSALGLTDNPKLQYLASKIYGSAKFPASAMLGEIKKRTPDGIIRIGYYSADFRDHVVSDLIVELFELHDSDRFEVYGFSFGRESNDPMRQRISDAFDHFIDVRSKSDVEIAQLSRSLGIDIAIDLGGYTQDSRTGIFALRCAPIQINYLGFPGTMGVDYIDYIIADKTMIPKESQHHYSEKIIYLPHSFQVNDSKRVASKKVFTRAEVGLPESGVVFCCFNNTYKILPETFDSWMRILKAVDVSVLWLFAEQAAAVQNLRHEASIRGVNPDRLVFAKRVKIDEHLARQSLADLFLDTLPFNAGATASAALWAGLPILTRMGESFTARYAASLLNAMDLPELITQTQAQYEAKAIELANNPLKLAQLKNKVQQNRQTSSLFNCELFTRNIEAAYAEAYRRYHAGENNIQHLCVESC